MEGMPEGKIKFVDCIIMPNKRKPSSKKSYQAKKRILEKAAISERDFSADSTSSRQEQNFGLNLFFKNFWEKVFNTFGEFKLTVGYVFKLLLASKIGLILVLATLVVPLTAFEAHVVNVTATIERRPCLERQVRTIGYWKNHPNERVFPQTVGDTTVKNNSEADAVFTLPNNVTANKLKKQLLALKFSIAYFGSGDGLVMPENITLDQLAAQADAALLADPQNYDQIAFYHNLIDEILNTHTISTCKVCPQGGEIYWYDFLINDSARSISDLRDGVNHGDHVTANFQVNPSCENVQLSLVSYKAPSDTFDENTADQQTVYQQQTGVFNGSTSTYSLEVDVPPCYFQIDFVKGPVIEHLGPAGSGNFYSAQGRLISADNGDPEGPSCDSIGLRTQSLVNDESEVDDESSGGSDLNSFGASILNLVQPLISDEGVSTSTDVTTSTDETSGEETPTTDGASSDSTSTIPVSDTTSTTPMVDSTPASSEPTPSSSDTTPPSSDTTPPADTTTPTADTTSPPPVDSTPPPPTDPTPPADTPPPVS